MDCGAKYDFCNVFNEGPYSLSYMYDGLGGEDPASAARISSIPPWCSWRAQLPRPTSYPFDSPNIMPPIYVNADFFEQSFLDQRGLLLYGPSIVDAFLSQFEMHISEIHFSSMNTLFTESVVDQSLLDLWVFPKSNPFKMEPKKIALYQYGQISEINQGGVPSLRGVEFRADCDLIVGRGFAHCLAVPFNFGDSNGQLQLTYKIDKIYPRFFRQAKFAAAVDEIFDGPNPQERASQELDVLNIYNKTII